MLVSLRDLIREAREGGYALGAFNTYNLEITAAIVGAAERLHAPVVVQTGMGALRDAAAIALPGLIMALARAATIPVAVHLDHCTDLALLERCLDLGYTSVMADGSLRSFEENIALTRRAVELAQRTGATVEAELAGIAGDEDNAATAARPSSLTDPAQAVRFVAATGVDLLAVAIGNVHGFYRGEPHLDFDLLAELREGVPVPLVLHGASGLPDEALRRAAAEGVVKVNFNTELRAAYFDALAEALPAARPGQDVTALMRASTAAVQNVVEEKLTLLGAAGRAAG